MLLHYRFTSHLSPFMIDFNKIKTYPIKSRKNKVSFKNFIRPDNNLPLLENNELNVLANKIIEAFRNKKQIIVMMGGHIIKVGCTPLIIDLMKKGIITHIAVNGSVAIHDFEIAFIGETSEDVAVNIEDGTFGMAEETGRMINEAVRNSAMEDKGFGEAIGKLVKDFEFREESLFYWAYKLNIPVTVHTSIGAEIIYQHPSCDGAAMGKVSYHDFKIFTDSISKLEGGVIINAGSAVIMPEVFLKAFTIARNLGFDIKKFTAANLDMIKHYRPTV
ncbi:MAG TPA: hypothetical protein PL110_03425, partial [Candidatus Eremiobacteraeota bacterium]|nr:hypothetical protein [Candidatus Eremiobacteraeota bacterium]